jgi:hypothetical protein
MNLSHRDDLTVIKAIIQFRESWKQFCERFQREDSSAYTDSEHSSNISILQSFVASLDEEERLAREAEQSSTPDMAPDFSIENQIFRCDGGGSDEPGKKGTGL